MINRAQLTIAALDEASRWRLNPQCATDRDVCALLAAYPSGSEVADLLWADLPADMKTEDVADLLSLWCWRTDDNGSQIMRTVERWIDESTDARKVGVAISLDAFPFIDHSTRLARMRSLGTKFPQFRSRCESIIAQTKEMMEDAR